MDYTGQRFGDYHLTQLLENGAFSEVYLGKHIKLGNIVAVKVLNRWFDDSEKDQFDKGMRSMAQLVHPHIARIRDFGVRDHTPFLVMDYLPYDNLRQRHPQGVQLPLTTVVEYVKQVAAALQYAHDQKIAHRGIRPEKMLVAQDKSILLSGFQAFVPLDPESDLAPNLELLYYIAPEQLRGKGGSAGDQYALGAVVYEWLCGEPPFKGSDIFELARHHVSSPPLSLREKVPTISPAIEGVIMTALTKEPQHRFATIVQFAHALEQASRPKIRKPEQLARLGQRFGRYRLAQFLGEGSFGDVYLGEHVRKDAKVAIKVLKAHLSKDELKQFINEARTVLLEHPHIIHLLDFGVESDDTPFLVMDYAPNGTLRERHPKGVTLPLSTIVSYVTQIAAALQYAHNQELIHRDLKPENLLLGLNKEVLLSDFGIAIIRHDTDSWVQQNIAGTAPYMAPEQFSAQAVPASDQYSLGVIVYEWLCGTRPFTAGDMGYHHNNTPPPPLHEKIPTISPEVEQVVMQALTKDPEQRFSSIQEFAEALEACLKPPIGTVFVTFRGHYVGASTVTWSPDGKQIASAGHDGTMQVWDAITGITHLTYKTYITENWSTKPIVTWSPDGRRLAFSNEGSTIQVLDIVTKHVITYQGHRAAYNQIDAISWSPDGRRIASASHKAGVHVWDTITGNNIFTYDKCDTAYVVAWSPNGKWIASSPGEMVQIWDANTGAILFTYRGQEQDNQPLRTISAIAWSPDSLRIASAEDCDNKCAVHLWDAATGTLFLTYRDHTDQWLNAVAWSPDGKRITSAGSQEIRVWDATTGITHLTYRGHSSGPNTVAWAPDGLRIISASSQETRVWDATTGATIITYNGHSDWVDTVVWSPDSKRLASASQTSNIVQIWDADTGDTLTTHYGHTDWINTVAWSPDGKYIASGGNDPVQVWDATTGTTILTYRRHIERVTHVAWSPDSKRIASCSQSDIHLWDVSTGTPTSTPKGIDFVGIFAMAWSPDGRRIAFSSFEMVNVWDTTRKHIILTYQGHCKYVPPGETVMANLVNGIAWSPDSRYIVSVASEETLIWDAITGTTILTYPGNRTGRTQVAWSPDGRHIASNSDDRAVHVWDATTGATIFTYRGHTDTVNAVAWSPNGKRLATASNGIHIWQAI